MLQHKFLKIPPDKLTCPSAAVHTPALPTLTGLKRLLDGRLQLGQRNLAVAVLVKHRAQLFDIAADVAHWDIIAGGMGSGEALNKWVEVGTSVHALICAGVESRGGTREEALVCAGVGSRRGALVRRHQYG
eukprot:354921-Chlamydomonas_euryale.AAC.20